MKTAVLTLALTLVVGRIPALAENLPWETRLPFKEATITYVLQGTEEGKEKKIGRAHV